jgi:hypothetical protein
MESLTKYLIDFTSGKEIIAKNFTNWTSGSEIIDKFIQEKQLKYNVYIFSAVFEWIPYSELLDIKEIEDSCFATAIFKKGSLRIYGGDWIRNSFGNVCLKYLHNSQDVTDEFIKKVFKFSMNLN